MDKNFLTQEEIDALLNSPEVLDDSSSEQSENQGQASYQAENNEDNLADSSLLQEFTDLEKDALGEIGNISMGSAATTLSQLLNQRVVITTPQVYITTPADLIKTFEVPFMIIDVTFVEGLEGSNLFILKVQDAAVIADLMMGGDGKNPESELSELHLSAVGEAMNQMMGSAATSMNTVFNKSIVISPPKITAVNYQQDPIDFPWPMDQEVVIVSFKMEIGNLINSGIMQVIPIETAREEADMLLGPANPITSDSIEQEEDLAPESIEDTMPIGDVEDILSSIDSTFKVEKPLEKPPVPTPPPYQENVRNIDLILDVPLNISVILGRTKKPIKEVLNLIPGSIVELEKLVDEPVEILVNGTPIAQGEVVVVNENFGIRIKSIESPTQRLNNLRK